ncbi:MAG: NAD(P)-dependent oxidoreductase [Candidatus Promineifilaceae bacterium]
MRIGFIGLGIMGGGMAANLQKSGYDLIVYNRTAEKAQPLVAAGAELASSPAQLAEEVNMLFTMLADPDAVLQTALGEEGFLPHLPAGALWIDCSTTNPSFARHMGAQANARGVRFIDAPVAGSKEPAANGELTFFAGASEEDLEDCRPEMESMGQHIFHAGAVGMGTSLKVVFNHQLAVAMASFAEGAVLGQELGIDREMLFDFLFATPVVAPFIQNKRSKMESGEYDTEFPLKLMQKDLHMASIAGYESGAALPLGSVAKEIYQLAIRSSYGNMDFSAIYQFLYEEWDVD